MLQLLCFSGPKLIDGDIGSLPGNLKQFFTWNTLQAQPARMQFSLPSSGVSVSSVVLFLFHSPSQHIGLPTITLAVQTTGGQTMSVSYDISGVPSDSTPVGLITVTLLLTTSTVSVTELFIDFEFTDANISWFLLSEVEIFEGQWNSQYTEHEQKLLYYNICSYCITRSTQ